MTVGELIERLRTFDPEIEVCIEDSDGYDVNPLMTVYPLSRDGRPTVMMTVLPPR